MQKQDLSKIFQIEQQKAYCALSIVVSCREKNKLILWLFAKQKPEKVCHRHSYVRRQTFLYGEDML